MNDIDRLAEMAELYQKCLDITSAALSGESLPDEDELTGLLQTRRKMLSRALSLENALKTKSEDGSRYLTGIKPEAENRAAGLLDRIRSLMNSLVKTDEALKERLEKGLVSVGDDLNAIRKGQSVLKAYAPFRGGASYFVDRHG